MQLMTVIKDTMATIGKMARGVDPFTEESAEKAKQTLLNAAADIENKFKLSETDPLSESSPAIWENWEDFVDKADDFSFMIEGLETASAESLSAGLGNIGQSCGSCHKSFRIKK
jgi:cytochrome c556